MMLSYYESLQESQKSNRIKQELFVITTILIMTDHYAVVGNPINHSRSPYIHRTFATITGQDISYEAILSPLDSFKAVVTDFFSIPENKGLNVTLPFKEQAYDLSEAASIY